MKYPVEYSRLEKDAKKLMDYVKVLNSDADLNPQERKELAFKAGLRLMRLTTELGNIGIFIDTKAPVE